ncbi:hypothetical protein HPB47_020865 [Ixodes persulcatus]|uniref:Uncharacterized protein n=1 Tax=Ixodes persulcatus TaxID=34615 RepID=A0AC60QHG3_IXOPE|nr:hypothetical protein HPB47_020865 [Ixodes persulcatus]
MDEQRRGHAKPLQLRVDQFLPRSSLSLLHPDIEQRNKKRLERTKEYADQHRGAWRRFSGGDQVMVKGPRADQRTPNRLEPYSDIETDTATTDNDDHDPTQAENGARTPRASDPYPSLLSAVTVGSNAPPPDNGASRPEAPPASPLLPRRTTRISQPSERYKPYTPRTF